MSSGGPNIQCCDGNKSPKHTYNHHIISLKNNDLNNWKGEKIVNYQILLTRIIIYSNATLKKCVFKSFLKIVRTVHDLKLNGNWFQTSGAAKKNDF